jgi:hypothetical protein
LFPRIAAAAWSLWALLFGIITWNLFRWHLDYFKSPGPEFFLFALALIPALAIASWAYSLTRRKIFLRYEAIAFAVLPASACLVYEPRAALTAAILFLSCSALGRFALRKFELPLAGAVEQIIAGFAAGLGMVSVALFAAGLAGLLYPITFVLLLALPLAMCWKDARRTLADLAALGQRWQQTDGALHPLAGIAVFFALLAMMCALMIALAPSVAFDAVAFHLPSVEFYASHHALRVVPGIDYSLYPQGMELIWTLAYALAGQPGSQILSILFFALFALLLVRLARECGLARGAAVLAAVFAITMPFLHWSGSVLKNDLALGLFEGLALLAFLRWMETRVFRWIVAGTFFLAQAFGIKLVALFGALPIACFYAYAAWREPRRARAAASVALVFLLFGTCWVARAYWLTGNPVAPETLNSATGKYAGSRTFAGNIARDAETPWRIFFAGETYFESPLPSPAGVILLAFGPLALFGTPLRTKWSAALVCAIFTIAYLIYWAVVIRKLRYAILPFGFLAIWIAAQLWRFYEAHSRAVRISLIGVTTYCFLIGAMGAMIVGINGPQFAYFLGRLDKPGYLRSAMTAYGSVDFLRTHAPGARIFGVENLARAYSADPSRFGGMFCPEGRPCDETRLIEAIRGFHPDYVILPESARIAPDTLARLNRPPRVYTDKFFSVYRLWFQGRDARQLDPR